MKCDEQIQFKRLCVRFNSCSSQFPWFSGIMYLSSWMGAVLKEKAWIPQGNLTFEFYVFFSHVIFHHNQHKNSHFNNACALKVKLPRDKSIHHPYRTLRSANESQHVSQYEPHVCCHKLPKGRTGCENNMHIYVPINCSDFFRTFVSDEA